MFCAPTFVCQHFAAEALPEAWPTGKPWACVCGCVKILVLDSDTTEQQIWLQEFVRKLMQLITQKQVEQRQNISKHDVVNSISIIFELAFS